MVSPAPQLFFFHVHWRKRLVGRNRVCWTSLHRSSWSTELHSSFPDSRTSQKTWTPTLCFEVPPYSILSLHPNCKAAVVKYQWIHVCEEAIISTRHGKHILDLGWSIFIFQSLLQPPGKLPGSCLWKQVSQLRALSFYPHPVRNPIFTLTINAFSANQKLPDRLNLKRGINQAELLVFCVSVTQQDTATIMVLLLSLFE